jgi:cytochrome c oxidase subunit 2
MNPQPTFQLPGQWSTVAKDVDWVYYFIYWTSVVLFVGIIGAMLYFVVKYRRRPGVKAEPTGHNTPLEVAWTIAPLFLLILLFHWGFKGYMDMFVPPADALEIRVRGQKWAWDFEYPNGAHTGNEQRPGQSDDDLGSGLTVPVGRPVRLVISSSDVIHSFFVPGFRIKHDAVPGMYSIAWFTATQTGNTEFTCAEYCGTGHSMMHGLVHIVSPERWQQFLRDSLRAPIDPATGQPVTPAQWGDQIFHQRGCTTCHGQHGEGISAPRLAGIFGHEQPLADGSNVTVDENYIRESILNPQAKVVRGFQPVMPSFAGQLLDNQIDALIAYIRSLH